MAKGNRPKRETKKPKKQKIVILPQDEAMKNPRTEKNTVVLDGSDEKKKP